MWKSLFAVLLLALVVVMVAPSVSNAQEVKILDSVVTKYNIAAKAWEPVLKQAAKKLFFTLCVISLIFTAGFGFLRGGMGLGDFFAEFLRFGVVMGLYYWLLDNGPAIAKSIIDSMTLLGQTASSNYVIKLTPSDICTQGFGLIYDAISEFGKSDYATGVMVIVIALIIALVYAVIAAQMIVLLCSSWILIYGGVFYLGFGGGNWTSDIAKNYFKTILAQAMQVFAFCLILGIGQTEILNLTSGLRTTKSVVVANYWWMFGLNGEPTKVVQSETLTMAGMCVALVFAVILAILVNRVPGMIAGVINGSSISAMAFSGVGGAIGSARGAMGAATGAVVGAGMMAAQMGGAKMALSSAYKAMQDHKTNGEGSFANGGATGGMRGAWHAATDMASSLSGGVGGVMQKITTGGQMSAHIDGQVQERKAEREKEQADNDLAAMSDGGGEGSGDAGSTGDLSSEGMSATGTGGASAASASDGATASSMAVSAGGTDVAASDGAGGGEDVAFSGGGSLSGTASSGGGDSGDSYSDFPTRSGRAGEVSVDSRGGASSSSSGARTAGSSMQRAAVSVGQSAFADSGGFGFDFPEADSELDEWNAAIANYDPSKAGLYDG